MPFLVESDVAIPVERIQFDACWVIDVDVTVVVIEMEKVGEAARDVGA